MNLIKKHWPILLITLIGLFLRIYHATDISLWHDEAFSALFMKYSWEEMMTRIALDVHPPAYYIALRLWYYVFGWSLLALRGFSVLCGVLTIPLGYQVAKEAFHSKRGAIFAAALLALNPFGIQYTTEVRMYTFGAAMALLAALFVIRAIKNQKELRELTETENQKQKVLQKKVWLYYTLTGLAVSVIIYTHYYLFFTAAAIGLYLLYENFRLRKMSFRQLGPLAWSGIIVVVSFLPWLKTFLFQFKQVSASFWIPPMDRWSIPSTIWEMIVSFDLDINKTANKILVSIITLFFLWVCIWLIYKISEKSKWLILFMSLAPFGGAILFSLLAKVQGDSSSVFLVRYFLFASVFVSISLGLYFADLKPKWLGTGLLVILLATNLIAYGSYYQNLKLGERQGMSAASKYLNENVSIYDKLLVGSSFEFFNLKYYNRSPLKPLLYSGGNTDVSNLPHFAGTAILTNEDLAPDFKTQGAKGDTIWLLWTNGFGGSKPEVPKNWKQTSELGYEDVRPYPGTWIVVTKYLVE